MIAQVARARSTCARAAPLQLDHTHAGIVSRVASMLPSDAGARTVALAAACHCRGS